MIPTLSSIARKWIRGVEKGKGLRLEGPEMDLLNAAGVGELVAAIAAAEQRGVAEQRIRDGVGNGTQVAGGSPLTSR